MWVGGGGAGCIENLGVRGQSHSADELTCDARHVTACTLHLVRSLDAQVFVIGEHGRPTGDATAVRA